MVDAELERERSHLDGLYRRLDELAGRTRDQLAAIRRLDVGGSHQGRSERDAFARLYEDRLRQYAEASERLAFGRLEVAPEPEEPRDGATAHRYIGRIGLRDADQQPILLDWRVPQASAFYQATAADPRGVRARRHLISRGRELLRIEDEVFDQAMLHDEGVRLQGEAAILAAVDAQRTGRMSDIVATIQAEQDRIIRSELSGILVVQGGPGTGKTAVALHRAAYLLYSHRERLRSSGLLVVGPSRSFLHYIEAVLPSLGESGVVLSSLGGLFPGVDTGLEDQPETAAIKGASRMAPLIARAVRSRQRVPAGPRVLRVAGTSLTLEPALVAAALARAQETGKPHNEARVVFVRSALTQLLRLYAETLRRGGGTVDEHDLPMLREELRTAEDVRIALNTAWLPLTPEKLIRDLYARPAWLAELTPGWSEAEREALHRERDSPFTLSDVPLLDEAAELLGELDAGSEARRGGEARRNETGQRRRDLEDAEQVIRDMGLDGLVHAEELAAGFAHRADRATTTAERAAADRTWTFGHVVVDEAQELSAMQWRLLLRRCPMRSFTIVGDIAQASSAVAAEDWPRALQPLLGRHTARWRLEELSVNYRTPAQIVRMAESMAIAHGLPITPSRAVRESRWPVELRRVADVVGETVRAVAGDRGIDPSATVAVVAPPPRLGGLHAALAAELGGLVGLADEGLLTPVTVLGPQEAKGLEFDAVVIAEPDRIVAQTPRGAGALYVAMTRATQRMYLIGDGPFPPGIA